MPRKLPERERSPALKREPTFIENTPVTSQRPRLHCVGCGTGFIHQPGASKLLPNGLGRCSECTARRAVKSAPAANDDTRTA